jgi:rubrerythrin
VSANPYEGDQPDMQCPKCGAILPDFDGFGFLAHTKPEYPDGCGYCTHPSRDDGVCNICGDAPISHAAKRLVRIGNTGIELEDYTPNLRIRGRDASIEIQGADLQEFVDAIAYWLPPTQAAATAAEVERLRAENAKLKAEDERSTEHLREVLRKVDEEQNGLAVCSWCALPTNSDAESKRAHQLECAKSPLVAKIEKMEIDHADVLVHLNGQRELFERRAETAEAEVCMLREQVRAMDEDRAKAMREAVAACERVQSMEEALQVYVDGCGGCCGLGYYTFIEGGTKIDCDECAGARTALARAK